jgi:hypothetical protein
MAVSRQFNVIIKKIYERVRKLFVVFFKSFGFSPYYVLNFCIGDFVYYNEIRANLLRNIRMEEL